MVRAACCCGAVRMTVEPAPTWVLDCNCSICRRYGGMWAYTFDLARKPALEATLTQGAYALEAYIWGDKELAVWRCKSCGCVMSVTTVDRPEMILAINARMFADFDPASVTIRRIDNALTGHFWTRPDAEFLKGRHPPVAPGEADWR